MTPDKFKSIVNAAVASKKPHLSSFGQSALSALARDYSDGKIDLNGAIEGLKSLYRENDDIDRHEFDEIEKRLKRS